MAAPTNLDEYMEKIIELRDQLKGMKNAFKSGVSTDLKDVNKTALMGFGLDSDKADYETSRLSKAKDVWNALKAFDNASI